MKSTKGMTWISRLGIAYLEWVYRTSKITLVENRQNADYGNCILGGWHGESSCTYLLFKYMGSRNYDFDLIATSRKRGDYIEEVGNYYGVNVLRIPDGIGIKGYLNYIREVAKRPNRSLIIALDGPNGPADDPKKLCFMLSNQADKPFVRANVDVRRKFRLFLRWDKYIIPLPYNQITFHIDQIDSVTKEQLKDFDELKAWCAEGRLANEQ